MSMTDLIRNSQVWKSIFRHPVPATGVIASR